MYRLDLGTFTVFKWNLWGLKPNVDQLLAFQRACQPRQSNHFPTALGGKAFDTALVLAWLHDELSHGSEANRGEW